MNPSNQSAESTMWLLMASMEKLTTYYTKSNSVTHFSWRENFERSRMFDSRQNIVNSKKFKNRFLIVFLRKNKIYFLVFSI